MYLLSVSHLPCGWSTYHYQDNKRPEECRAAYWIEDRYSRVLPHQLRRRYLKPILARRNQSPGPEKLRKGRPLWLQPKWRIFRLADEFCRRRLRRIGRRS